MADVSVEQSALHAAAEQIDRAARGVETAGDVGGVSEAVTGSPVVQGPLDDLGTEQAVRATVGSERLAAAAGMARAASEDFRRLDSSLAEAE